MIINNRFSCCYGLNVLSLPSILIPNVIVLGDGDFRGYLSHGSGTFMNGINVLTKETPPSLLVPSSV